MTAKRQKRTPGSIVKIDLGDGYHSYARILEAGLAFYDIRTKEDITDMKRIIQKPILFITEVYNHAITKGRWPKVGKVPLEDTLKKVPLKFIQDPIKPEEISIYDPNTGNIRPATREECEGLERAAVWEPEHIEDRLRDHYAGVPNKWVESLKIKD